MPVDFLSRTATRRQFTLGTIAGAAVLTALPAPPIFAAQATPAPDFSALGYPELKVTITENAFKGIPESLPAGRYLLTATIDAPVLL